MQTCAILVKMATGLALAGQSQVWVYFSKLPDGSTVKCGKCDAKLAYTMGSTSAMKRHLSRIHDITIDSAHKRLKTSGDCQSTGQCHSQPKLSSFLALKQKLPGSSPKAKKLTYKVAKAIFLDLQFEIVILKFFILLHVLH